MIKRMDMTIGWVLGLVLVAAGVPVSAESSEGGGWHEVSGEGAGVSFNAMLPSGFELQGLGPEWYVMKEGANRPLVLVKFQMGKTIEGVIDDGFGRVDERAPIEFGDEVSGTVVTGSYQAPPETEYVQRWYLHPAPGEDGIFMLAEFRAEPWASFEAFAESFRHTREQ